MNETATTIHLTADGLFYDGPLGRLAPHRHGTLCLLVGRVPFVLGWADTTVQVGVALIPPGVVHTLDFGGRRIASVYVDPNSPAYPRLLAATSGCPVHEAGAAWQEALHGAVARQSAAPLLTQALDRWGLERGWLDNRVLRITRAFASGQRLDDPSARLAAWVGVSTSRLTHLVSSQTGGSLGRLRHYYRFRLAAAALATGDDLGGAAHAAGFADAAHFSRAFRQTFGQPPSVLLAGTVQWTFGDSAHLG